LQNRQWFQMWCGQSPEDAYSSMAHDPALAFVGGGVLPYTWLYITMFFGLWLRFSNTFFTSAIEIKDFNIHVSFLHTIYWNTCVLWKFYMHVCKRGRHFVSYIKCRSASTSFFKVREIILAFNTVIVHRCLRYPYTDKCMHTCRRTKKVWW
jgi:hypothetical protein